MSERYPLGGATLGGATVEAVAWVEQEVFWVGEEVYNGLTRLEGVATGQELLGIGEQVGATVEYVGGLIQDGHRRKVEVTVVVTSLEYHVGLIPRAEFIGIGSPEDEG